MDVSVVIMDYLQDIKHSSKNTQVGYRQHLTVFASGHPCKGWRSSKSITASPGLPDLAENKSQATQEGLLSLDAAGQTVQIQVLGLASIAEDVSPELALATIDAIEVLGALRASAAVKAALAGRIR